MNNNPAGGLPARIIVLLGNSDTDRTTLEILSLLTAGEPSEILGLFLEDTELLALAKLPVAREYCQLTHAEQRLEAADLERRLRIQVRTAKQALADIARRSDCHWSFRTVRDSLTSLLADRMLEMDLLLLGTARNFHSPATRQALPRPAPGPVAVIFDGSEAAQRALVVARRMAGAGNQSLTMLLIATDTDGRQEVHTQAAEPAGPAVATYRELTSTEPGEILAAAHAARASALVVGLGELMPPDSIEKLCSRLRCPAVLVR